MPGYGARALLFPTAGLWVSPVMIVLYRSHNGHETRAMYNKKTCRKR